MEKRRALILYATMTKNTEKVATWFKETFEEYNWDVTFVKLKMNNDWAALQPDLYFEDYDVVCLGSPIVGGGPLQTVVKTFSFGGDGSLEKTIDKNLSEKKKGNDAAAPAVAPKGPRWRRAQAPYDGVLARGEKWPLGLVFTTYGGGFYGAAEATATLAVLKMYLTNHYVNVVAQYSAGGKETGPAGYDLGVKPAKQFMPGKPLDELEKADVPDAIEYEKKDGTKTKGSYFFHYDNNSKPGPKEEARARILVSDLVEDYFMTYDGVPNIAISEILSLS